MAKPRREKWGTHVFLNDATSGDHGWIHGTVWYPKWMNGLPEVTLTIGDCSRVVTLDFDVDPDDGDSKESRLRKLQRLREVVNEFVDHASLAIHEAKRDKQKADKPKEGAA